MKHYAERIKTLALSRNLLKGEKIRACIYARVSTDKEGQAESCQNQVAMARKVLSDYPNIELVQIFVDDGISGKSDFNRPEYNQMLKMIEDGVIDLIVVKDFSRLNRDQYNSLGLITFLREKKATIFTLLNNTIHDLEDSNEAIFNSISFVMDEKYSHDQQEKARQVHQDRVDNLELSAKDVCFGYEWDTMTKTIHINEEAAKLINNIYTQFALENKTVSAIYEDLMKLALCVKRLEREKDANGKKTSKRKVVEYPLTYKMISRILQNPKYIGEFTINKLTTIYSRSKNPQRVKLPEEEWVTVYRPDLCIVDKKLFDLAQRIRESHLTPACYRNGEIKKMDLAGWTHPFSHLIQCTECGKYYQYDESGRKKVIPRYRIKMHSDCDSPQNSILEEDLEKIIRISLQSIYEDKQSILSDLMIVLEAAVRASQDNSDEVRDLMNSIEKLNKQYETLRKSLRFTDSDEILQDITNDMNQINENRNKLKKELEYKKSIQLDENFISSKLKEIKEELKELSNFKDLNTERVKRYIKNIFISPNGDITIYYNSKYGWNYTESLNIKDSNADINDVGTCGQRDDRCSVPATYPTLPPP